MADNNSQPQDIAEVSYRMASNIWRESGKAEPKLSDEQFLQLVSSCSLALQGRFGAIDYRDLR